MVSGGIDTCTLAFYMRGYHSKSRIGRAPTLLNGEGVTRLYHVAHTALTPEGTQICDALLQSERHTWLSAALRQKEKKVGCRGAGKPRHSSLAVESNDGLCSEGTPRYTITAQSNLSVIWDSGNRSAVC